MQVVDQDTLAERAARYMSSLPRPIVRWAGSKQRLLNDLVPVLPTRYGRYYEPFAGSAALFFLLQPSRATLGDSCAPLVATYKAIASDPQGVAAVLKELDPLNRDQYYAVRAHTPCDPVEAAARFLYLNRSCWNGLYRVNSQGIFNVPYGAPKTANLPGLEWLTSCAKVLGASDVTLRVGDFASTVRGARAGDLVFFDPPYVTGHNNNGFVDYNEVLFSWSDQIRLASLAEQLKVRGVNVVITNAMHGEICDLYKGFEIRPIDRYSTLANNKEYRRPVTEALIFTRNQES
jgi:DNA adenine methylase